VSTWAEQRRADRVADREQDRLDRDADRVQARADAADREKARADRRSARKAWRAAHTVELFIYPLAAVSALMSVPAMAGYGWDLYGNPTGLALPLLSELGVWAFAMAVLRSRQRHPDRPTGMLTAGVVLFGMVAFGMNLAHGLSSGHGVAAGPVMAVVSVAGVIAHQLAIAAPPRGRAERAAARLARQADRRVDQARRAAIRRAVVDLAADGTARLVHTPGTYTTRRRLLARTTSLTPTTLPALPVTDPWDAALVDLDVDAGIPEPALGVDPLADSITTADQPDPDTDPGGSGGVAVADPPAPTGPPAGRRQRPKVDPQARRKLTPAQALTAARRLARKNGRRVSAEQIRTTLGISPSTARELRDRVNAEIYPDGAA